VKEISFPLSSVNINASDGELRHINRQSSSSKDRTRHSLLKELNLASLSELTPRKRKLCEHIQNKESALSKLKNKYMDKKLKKLCDVDSDPGCQIFVSNSLLALSFLHLDPNPIFFSAHYSPLHPRQSLQSVLNTVPFRTGISPHVFHALQHTLQKMSHRDQYCCLMFDEKSVKENLHFSQNFDCIEGFEECGSWGRIWNIANHSIVFMIHSLCRKWKQPVAY
jgi:hypothetical protein